MQTCARAWSTIKMDSQPYLKIVNYCHVCFLNKISLVLVTRVYNVQVKFDQEIIDSVL